MFTQTKLFKEFNQSYKQAYQPDSDDSNFISWGSFHKYWNEQYPYLEKITKKTYFCDVCCKLQTIINDKIYSQNEHNLAQQNLNSHLEIVKKSRNHYNENRIKYALEEGKTVLCFDYS